MRGRWFRRTAGAVSGVAIALILVDGAAAAAFGQVLPPELQRIAHDVIGAPSPHPSREATSVAPEVSRRPTSPSTPPRPTTHPTPVPHRTGTTAKSVTHEMPRSLPHEVTAPRAVTVERPTARPSASPQPSRHQESGRPIRDTEPDGIGSDDGRTDAGRTDDGEHDGRAHATPTPAPRTGDPAGDD